MKIAYIYILVDPRKPEEVRYVGKTNNPKVRLTDHICEARRRVKLTYKNNWIAGLLTQNIKPELKVIETIFYTYDEEWVYFEGFWIKFYLSNGHPLTNYHLEGGSGSRCTTHPPCSEETKAKISKGNRGKIISPEQLKNMSESHKGKKLSPESIAKRTAKQKGLKRTQETKDKLSKALTGKKLSPESIAKREATKRKNGTHKHTEETKRKIKENHASKKKK